MRRALSLNPFAGAATALVALLGLSACQPATVSDTTRRLSCQVLVDAPERDNDAAPKKIVTRVRYYCDPPGMDRLALTLRLQRQNARGGWSTVATTAVNAKKAQTTPPDKGFYRVRELAVRCSDGVFRAQVVGSSKGRGVNASYDSIGPRTFDPCKPSLFAS